MNGLLNHRKQFLAQHLQPPAKQFLRSSAMSTSLETGLAERNQSMMQTARNAANHPHATVPEVHEPERVRRKVIKKGKTAIKMPGCSLFGGKGTSGRCVVNWEGTNTAYY
ncbi:hypothetical protein ACWF50_12660 [Brucella pseudogrignonensis]